MAASTTTSLDDLFTNIVAEARFTASEQSLLRNLVNGFDVSDQEGLTVQVPKYISVAASGLTEGTDLTSTQVTTSNVSMTVAESGVQAVLTDLAAKSTTGDTAGDMGFILGDGVATKIDTDVIGLFTSFTTNALGAAGQEITPADIFKASAILRNKKVRAEGLSKSEAEVQADCWAAGVFGIRKDPAPRSAWLAAALLCLLTRRTAVAGPRAGMKFGCPRAVELSVPGSGGGGYWSGLV
jgi:hypothetical protein